MPKKSAQVIDMQLSKDTKELKEIVGRRERDKLRGGELLAKHEAVMRKNSLWLKWLSDDIGITEPTAIHWIKIYEQNQGAALKNFSSTPRKDKGISSGRTAGAGGRGRGGGKGTTTDSVAAAATSPADPTPAPQDAPVAAGQEGAAPASTSAPSAPSANPMPGWLEKAQARIKELEEAQAVLMETNRDLARQLETAEATQVAEASEKRISGLLELLQEANQRIDELQSELTAGYDQSLKNRLDNQSKLIEDLRRSEAEQRRCADAARKPGPRGLGTMFQLMARGDKMEFIRSIASFDDPSPGADDADKVGWIDHIFRKIHSPQMKRELLGNLSGGELADTLAERKVAGSARTAPPSADERVPVEHRRLAEPGALSKENQYGKRSNGKHAT